MIIQKQLTGDVWLVENGENIKTLSAQCTFSLSYKKAGIDVIDLQGRQYFIPLVRVQATQILPAAEAKFTGDLDALWTLLVTYFFDELHISATTPVVLNSFGNLTWVRTLSDFPTPSAGVITLAADTAWFLVGDIDLAGSRLVTSGDTTILGSSSETSSLTSTGLGAGVPLITSAYTLAMHNISIQNVDKGFVVSGALSAFDWSFVNFENVPNIGDLNGCSNFVFFQGAFLEAKGFVISGTVATVSLSDSLFSNTVAGTIITVSATAVISRRFRIIYSSFVAPVGVTAIDFNLLASVPIESYILDTVNFSGGGTYLAGVIAASNFTLFQNCRGIANTAVNGQMYMQGNAVATVVAAANTFYKVAGVTTASVDNAKYLMLLNNRLTNDAVIERKFTIVVSLSFSSAANNVCRFGIYDSRLGAVRTPSRTTTTANAAGRAENVSLHCAFTHSQGDYIEIWAENTTAANNITVTDMNVLIFEI
jgi:hypothetical protein